MENLVKNDVAVETMNFAMVMEPVVAEVKMEVVGDDEPELPIYKCPIYI